MAEFDPTSASLEPGQFDPSSATLEPPPAPRGALGEIATGALRGLVAGVPEAVGKSSQFLGNMIGSQGMVTEGQTMRGAADILRQKSWLAPQTAEHGGFTNTVAQAAEGIGSFLPTIAAGAVNPLVGLGLGAAQMAGTAGEEKLEQARAKGMSPEAARSNALTDAGIAGLAGLAGGALGGKMMGMFGSLAGRVVGQDGSALAADVLGKLSGQQGTLMPFLKTLPKFAAEGTGVMVGQAGLQGAVDQAYGSDDAGPLEAMKNAFLPSLATMGLLAPLGLAAYAKSVGMAKSSANMLSAAETDPVLRQKLAAQYAGELGKVNPDAATAFMSNAATAIGNKLPMAIDPKLFSPGTITVPQPEAPPQPPLALGAPQMRVGEPTLPSYSFPDGSSTNDVNQVYAYLNGLPPEQRAAARASIFGFEAQPTTFDAATMPPAPEPPGNALLPSSTPLLPAPERATRGDGTVYVNERGEAVAGKSGAFQFPDGTSTDDPVQVSKYVDSLPEDQRALAWAKIVGSPEAAARPTALVPTNTIEVNREGTAMTPAEREAYARMSPVEQAAVSPEAQQMHAQIKDELTAAGQTPAEPMSRAEFNKSELAAGLKGQALAKAYSDYLKSPSTAAELMREDAEAYTALKETQAPEATPAAEVPLEAPEPRLNTQLSDALETARKESDVEAAHAQLDTAKAAETEALANRAAGEREAAAAAAGEIKPDLNAPKQADEIHSDVAAVNEANGFDTRAQSMVPFMKRLDALGLDKLPDHDAQIAKLQEVLSDRSVKMSDVMRDRMQATLDAWKAERTPEPAAPEAAAPAQPAPVVKANGTEVAAAKPSETAGTPVQKIDEMGHVALLAEARNTYQALKTANEKLIARWQETGQKLTPADQRRWNDVRSKLQLFSDMTGENHANYGDDFVRGELRNADKVLTGDYSNGRGPLALVASKNMDEVNPSLFANSNRLVDTLANIRDYGSTPAARAMARQLMPLVGDTKLEHGWAPPPESPLMRGQFDPMKKLVSIFQGGETEHAILHESSHAALEAAIYRAQSTRALTQRDVQMKRGVADLEVIRQEAMRGIGQADQYGLSDVHEFVAELDSNPLFQQWLKGLGENKSLWDRVVDTVRKIFGMSVDHRDMLEKALEARDTLFNMVRDQHEFYNSPEGAGYVMDRTAHALVEKGDELTKVVSLDKANRAVARTMLPTVTLHYIADRMRAIPEIVQSGFSRGLDAMSRAYDSRDLVAKRIEETNGAYVNSVRQIINKLPAEKQSAMQMQMMKLGGEAAIGQFDYKLNYAENKKLYPDLSDQNKGFIDGIHREFKQLQASNPELANSLVRGEQLNRKMLVNQFSTMVRLALETQAGVTGRLEAELSRMAPEDAARARFEQRVANARIDSQLAAKHAQGLDFMAKDLDAVKNPDEKRYVDGASAMLATRLNAAFIDARALPQGSNLRQVMADLEEAYRPQERSPYFSLGRNGNFFVNAAFRNMDAAAHAKVQDALRGTNKIVGDLTGDGHAFFRFKTEDEANGIYTRLKSALGDKIDLSRSGWGPLAEDHMTSVSGVTPALRQMLADIHDEYEAQRAAGGMSAEQAAQYKAIATRSLMSLLPETAARSAKMERRGVAGYDGDFTGNFARRASGAVQDLSNIYTARTFTDAQKQMKDALGQMNVSGSADAKIRAADAYGEVMKRYANSMTRLDNSAINQAASLGHSYYLAGNIAYIIRTMAQPWHRGLPHIGSKFGYMNAVQELPKATATALQLIKNTIAAGYQAGGGRGVLDANMVFKDMGLKPNEEQFMQEMHDLGKFDLGQSRQLAQLAVGGSQGRQDLIRIASMFPQYTEMANRVISGLATYRLAMRELPKRPGNEGLSADQLHAMASDTARRAVEYVMDDFSPSNTARILSKHGPLGATAPLLTMFQNFNFQTTQQIARTIHDGYFSGEAQKYLQAAGDQKGLAEVQQRSREARSEFKALLATTSVIAGVMGLPFANAIAGAYNLVTSDRDAPSDIRISARNGLARLLGQPMGDVISHGVGSLVNVDTSNFGLENLLPGSEFLADRRSFQDRIESQSQQLLGPAVNAAIDVGTAFHKISQGYVVKGIESLLPPALKSPFKAAELAGVVGPGGYTDTKGNRYPMQQQPNAWNILAQAVGFRSADLASHSELQQDLSTNKQLRAERRGVIADEFYKAVQPGASPDDVKVAVADMQAYNAKNRTEPMLGIQQLLRSRMQEFAIGRSLGVGVPVGKREVPYVRQEGYFAMPERK